MTYCLNLTVEKQKSEEAETGNVAASGVQHETLSKEDETREDLRDVAEVCASKFREMKGNEPSSGVESSGTEKPKETASVSR